MQTPLWHVCSQSPYRRLQWDIGITYGNDVATARKVILDILNSDDRVVKQYIEDDDEARKAQAALNPQSSENVADIDDATPAQKRSIVYRMFHSGKRTVDNKLQEIERQNELTRKQYLPKVDRTPTVTLGNLGASSVDLTVRAWVRSEFYWGVFYDMNERFYNELPANGISFPFPQLDVHLDTPTQA